MKDTYHSLIFWQLSITLLTTIPKCLYIIPPKLSCPVMFEETSFLYHCQLVSLPQDFYTMNIIFSYFTFYQLFKSLYENTLKTNYGEALSMQWPQSPINIVWRSIKTKFDFLFNFDLQRGQVYDCLLWVTDWQLKCGTQHPKV